MTCPGCGTETSGWPCPSCGFPEVMYKASSRYQKKQLQSNCCNVKEETDKDSREK